MTYPRTSGPRCSPSSRRSGTSRGISASAQLQPADMATTVRRSNGQTLTTDGPFADTKEVFGGYYLFDVADVDAALSVAERIPAVRLGGSVEVRPIMEPRS